MVILGFLRKGPLHGYELKRVIERDMGDWAGIAFGSIYFALSKLAEDGCVTPRHAEGVGRPSRIIYTITRKGREEFRKLLRECWARYERHTDALDLGIAFMDDLETGEARAFMEERVRTCEHALSYLAGHEKEEMANPGVPAQARFIFSHAHAHLQTELEWARSVVKELGDGRLGRDR